MKGWTLLTLLIIASGWFLFAGPYELPPMETVQRGYRGTGMVQVYNHNTLAEGLVVNQLPAPVDPLPPRSDVASANVTSGMRGSTRFVSVPVDAMASAYRPCSR